MSTALKQERKKRGWTLEHVAKHLNTTISAIQKIETGRRKPSYDVLVKLLDLFNYNDPRELFAESSQSQIEDSTIKREH